MNDKPIDSRFLTGRSIPQDRDLSRVLVVGGAPGAAALAQRISGHGFEVVLLGPGDGIPPGSSVTVMPHGVLAELEGFVGAFTAVIHNHGQESRESVGLVVAAPPARVIPQFDRYGIGPSDRIISLTDLECRLRGQSPIGPISGDRPHIAFLCGLAGESDPLAFSRLFNVIEHMHAQEPTTRIAVFTSQVKVAGPGLELRYRQCRERGVLFFKFDDGFPVCEETDNGVRITFVEPILGRETELTAAMLVVDELHQPSPALAPLLEAIPASVTFRPFARPDSTRFPTVQTPKAGIFAAGPARGSLSLDVEEAEFDVLVSALSSANLAPAPRTFPGPPAIDRDKCAFCLTCVRICPHGAMGFHTIAQADPASCFRCGICVSECPMGAISLAPPGTAANVENPLEDAAEPALSGHIVAFLCARSAELARQDARLSASPSFKPVIVPCAGSVRTEQILDAFAGHAGGVLVAGCHPGNCASVQGTLLARERAQAIARFLTEAGYDSQRLLFTTLAANSRTDLVIAAETLRSRIRGSAGTLGGPQQ